MLFNSFEFIFLFLPLVFCIWVFLRKNYLPKLAIFSLLVSSLLFYAYWNPPFVFLLLASITINFFIQRGTFTLQKTSCSRTAKTVLFCGITFNILLIGYFKYKNFFLYNMDFIFGRVNTYQSIFLPLGISFFTFQQIACLIDSYKRKLGEIKFCEYALFVSFFPQLIAGPIVKYEELIPQIQKAAKDNSINLDTICLGLSLFAFGLFKKITIADYFSPISIMLFDSTALPTFYDTILGTLAYTIQIYFDFSGYSDMALGLGFLFGVALPQNFNSPYQSLSIIDFWRRWHITLSNFLKDYIYIPLGGNRGGHTKKYINLLLTMLIGGLWHGAGWNFIIWGGLHGFYLVVNNLYRSKDRFIKLPNIICWLLTFSAVSFAWIFFRAPSLSKAREIIYALLSYAQIFSPSLHAINLAHDGLIKFVSSLIASIFISIFMPNAHKTLLHISSRKYSVAVISGICFAASLWMITYTEKVREFLYFQF